MQIAPLPANEHERIAALRLTELLDSECEAAFDLITRTAADVCGVPIAVVSLIDDHRQWFKSQVGLDGVTSTSRDVAFCSHAILQPRMLEVPDATADPRFADNPLVAGGPGIRFYAGIPLVMPGGTALGTLCVIDRKPRKLSPKQRRQLALLADSVRGLIERRVRPSERAALLAAVNLHGDAYERICNWRAEARDAALRAGSAA